MVMEVSGGKPWPIEKRMLATFYAALQPDGLNRSIELVQEGLAEVDDADRRLELVSDLGVYQLLADQPEAALDSFELMLELDPGNAVALNNAAAILTDHLDRPGEALSYAEQAVESRPSDWAALDTLGWTYFKLGRLDDAESSLRRSYGLSKQSDNCYHLAEVFFAQSENDQSRVRLAERYLSEAAELTPNTEMMDQINALSDKIRASKQ